MAISYRPLWVQLSNKGLKKNDVVRQAQITTNVMARMGKNQAISIENLEKIYKSLNCSPNDVFRFFYKENGGANETDC